MRSHAQLEAAISGLVDDAKSGGESPNEQIRAVIHSYYDHVVDPRLAAVEMDASLAAGAVS